jgi:transcriptional regulator of arginine metabolism
MSHDAILDGHILNIVQNQEIQEQGDLQKILKYRGFDVPQATLSRRLKKLKIVKVSGTYQTIEFNQPYLPIILSLQVSESSMVVLRTHPGNANSLAFFIDQNYITYSPKDPKQSGILGTLAGDDTVLVILKSMADLDSVLSVIQADFPYLKID